MVTDCLNVSHHGVCFTCNCSECVTLVQEPEQNIFFKCVTKFFLFSLFTGERVKKIRRPHPHQKNPALISTLSTQRRRSLTLIYEKSWGYRQVLNMTSGLVAQVSHWSVVIMLSLWCIAYVYIQIIWMLKLWVKTYNVTITG